MFSLQLFSTDEIIFFGRGLNWCGSITWRKEKRSSWAATSFFVFFFIYGVVFAYNKKTKQNKKSRYFVSVVIHKAENVKQGYNR